MRAWSAAAAEGGAFTKLRVLILRNHEEITSRSLEYLNSFPSLTLYKVFGCNVGVMDEEKAKGFGWSCESSKELLDALLKDKRIARSWDLSIHACFRRAGGLSFEMPEVAETEHVDSLPVLNFWIGPTARLDLLTSLLSRAMLCFQRQQPEGGEAHSNTDSKRRQQEDDPSLPRPAKRRKMKVSKQQKFEDLLQGFGGL